LGEEVGNPSLEGRASTLGRLTVCDARYPTHSALAMSDSAACQMIGGVVDD
jgi:hypothetical protein